MTIHVSEVDVPRPSFLGGGKWSLKKLSGVNALFGRNGSGKSILLRNLRDVDPASSHYIVPERSGDISFEPGLIAEVIEAARRRNVSQTNFLSNYRQHVVTRIQGYYTRRGSKRVADIKHDPEDLLRTMSLVLPDFTVQVRSESPFYDLRRSKDGSSVTSVANLSSGESQLLSVGLDIVTIVGMWELDDQKKRLLLVDEPDAHIHPDLQIKLADFLCHIAQEFKVQVFVATHSTTLLAALGQFGASEAAVLFVTADVPTLNAEPFSSISRELAALLGGHLLMGPLFGAPVLLVEGDDDYRVWVQVVRSGLVNLCVLPCNGDEIKTYRRTLERMFDALSENVQLRGYALVDGDKYPDGKPDAKYVPVIRLGCREIENLYLTDEVLQVLGHNWDAACALIEQKAGNYGEKAEALAKIRAVDRRNDDLKAFIHQVAEILDPIGLLWTVRLGKILGQGRPGGMLADFVGAEVISAVWPSASALSSRGDR
jgi:predicted ATPase